MENAASNLDKVRLMASSKKDACIEVGPKMEGFNDTIIGRILENAQTNPFAPCIRGPMCKIDGTVRELCYYDFVKSAEAIAMQIKHSLGIDNGDTSSLRDRFIAIYLKRDIEYVLAQFAIFLCGAAYLPLSDKLPDERLAYILRDAKPKLIITTEDIKMRLVLEVAQEMNEDPDDWVEFFCVEDVDGIIDETNIPPHERKVVDLNINELSRGLAGPKNLAYMIYTSGTTGNPNGVEVEHHSLLNVLCSHVHTEMIDMEDLRYSLAVTAFIFDSHVRETWLPILYGGCIVIAEDVLHLSEGTTCAGTPTGLQAAAAAKSLPASLKTIMAGGERLTGAICKAISHPNTEVTKIINAYGPTETVVESLVWVVDLSDGCNNMPEVPIGLPVANAVAYGIKLDASGVRDNDITNQILNGTATVSCLAKRGEPCELYIGGEAVARGYHNRPDINSQKFVNDPFQGNGGRMYQTGDLVIFPENSGQPLHFIGRVDTQVKIRGKRLELGEVENYLSLYPAVYGSKVLLKTLEGKGHLVAYVLWKDDALKEKSVDELERGLLEFARMTMEDYKRPFVVSFPLEIAGVNYTTFPMTIGGKVNTNIFPDVKTLNGDAIINQMRVLGKSSIVWGRESWISPAALEAMEEVLSSNETLFRRRSSRLTRHRRSTGSSTGSTRTLKGTFCMAGHERGSVKSMKMLMSKVGSQEDKDQALSDLASVERRASAALIGKIPRVNDAPLNETDLPTNKEALRIVQILLEVVLSLLMPRIRLDGCVRVTADDDVFALGLTSLDVPRLKFVVKQRLNRYIETEQIFLNPTVNRMAVFLIKPPEENGADLNLPELVDAGLIKDKALPHWAVWILTLICSFGFHGLSICFMIFLVLLQFVFLHECGKCSSRGSIGRVDHMLQTHCEDPDLFFAFLAVVVGFPIVMVITITITLLMVVLVKWVVVGKYKPGVYSIDGPYYFRWLYVHYLEVFARNWLLVRLPFRSTYPLIWYYRLMGANIGNHVNLATLDVHEMCCLTIEDGVTVQNDAMLSGHTFATARNTIGGYKGIADAKPVLIIGRCWIKKDSVVGPYAMVQPPLPRPFNDIGNELSNNSATVVEGILPAMQATSRLGQTLRLSNPMMTRPMKDGKYVRPDNEPTVWTPAIPGYVQFLGFLVMILLHWIASLPLVGLVYAYLVPAAAGPGILVWFLRLWVLHSPYLTGIIYIVLVASFKWISIGKFEEGPCTPYLDNMRWLLQCLLQNGLHRVFELSTCSTEILNHFYRFMGMQIGWNAQIMPLNIVEFDLFEIGDCVIIGEQVMMVARDANGLMKKCRIGNDSAITTSAIMLAGSHVGNHCLVGNLTVLPPDFQVPDVLKCIGTKYMLGFHQPPVIVANTEEERQPSWQSNLTMTMHCALALLWDVVEMPGMILLSYILVQIQNQVPSIQNESHLFVIPLGIPGAYLIVNLIIAFLCTSTSLVLIVVKRFSCGFFGSYNRGSPISVFFIFMTKLQMNQQMWTQIINGTPWQSLNYNNWGADIACSARLFMRSFADVTGLRVCANSVLDYDCCLEQHQNTSTKIEFHPLTINENCVIGQRSVMLHSSQLGKGGWVYPLSAVPPNVTIDPEEVVGGILEISYFRREPEAILASSTEEIRTRRPHTKRDDDVVDIVVVGAGAAGLVAAYEFMQQGLSVKILEKNDKILGCWESAANETSHLSVSEATYRFPGVDGEENEGDYPSRSKVLENGHKFFEQLDFGRVTEFRAKVIDIKDISGRSQKIASAKGQKDVFKHKHGYCEVTYKKDEDSVSSNLTGTTKTLRCSGVFIATGAQCEQNHHNFPEEETFKGYTAYGSANDTHEVVQNVKGKNVVIVGSGAFAIENIRTMLINGAKHVTLVHRSTLQVWPRCIHYLFSKEKDRPFSDYAEVYERAANWAGFTIGDGDDCALAPLMHPTTKAQPSISDAFFGFAKLGLVTLVRGEIMQMREHSAVIQKKIGGTSEIECDVLLKCIGWKQPLLKTFFPQFTHRNFVFLNGSPRVMFVCDPRYSRGTTKIESEIKDEYATILDTVPIGGTFSVLVLARVMAWLHMYVLGNDVMMFNKMLTTMPSSTYPTCTWGEQQFSFPTNKECSDLIRFKIGYHKDLVLSKHPSVNDFFIMSCAYLQQDISVYELASGIDVCEGSEVEFKEAMMDSKIMREIMNR